MRGAGRVGRRSARCSPTRSTVALRAAEQTDGAVDPTVGRAMRAIGYDADFATSSARDRPDRAPPRARSPAGRPSGFDASAREVRLPGRASSSTSARRARRSPPTWRPRPRSRPSTGRAASSSRSAATSRRPAARPTAAGGSSSPRTARPRPTPAGESIAIDGGRDRDLEHDRSPLAARRPGRCTTSSTRGPAAGRLARGGPSSVVADTCVAREHRGDRRDRPRPTRRPSSGLRRRPACRPRLGRPSDGRIVRRRRLAGSRDAVGAPAVSTPDPVVRHARRRDRLPDPLQHGRLPRAARRSPGAQSAAWPRFLTVELHRTWPSLSVAFLALHIVTAILDPFTSLGDRRRGHPARLRRTGRSPSRSA